MIPSKTFSEQESDLESQLSHFENQVLLHFLQQHEKSEELCYSLTAKVIDFMSAYLYSSIGLNKQVTYYLLNLLDSKHEQIRERASQAIVRSMVKHHKAIRREIILSMSEPRSDIQMKEYEKLLNICISPFYFNFGALQSEDDTTEDNDVEKLEAC